MTICLSSETSKNKRSILINIAIYLLLIIPSRQYIYLLQYLLRGEAILYCNIFSYKTERANRKADGLLPTITPVPSTECFLEPGIQLLLLVTATHLRIF